jgi:hypothetical protein
MLSRHLREMERQAGVVSVKRELPVGSWMVKNEVVDYLYHRICKVTLAHIVESILDAETSSNGIEYLRTSDIRNVMMPNLFREMECEITTIFIAE